MIIFNSAQNILCNIGKYHDRYIHGSQWPNLRESDFDQIGADSGVGFNCNIPLNKVPDQLTYWLIRII